MEFKTKKVMIVGTGGSGKTIYAGKLWKQFNNPMAYDINGDYKKLPGGISYEPDDIDGEFNSFLDLYFKITKTKKIDALFFDDCDVYINYETAANPIFKDLVVRHRNPKHNVSLIFISKKPQAIPTLIAENVHYTVIFKIEGFNALNRLHDIDPRLDPLIEEVSKKPFSFIIKKEGEMPLLMPPVKL